MLSLSEPEEQVPKVLSFLAKCMAALMVKELALAPALELVL